MMSLKYQVMSGSGHGFHKQALTASVWVLFPLLRVRGGEGELS